MYKLSKRAEQDLAQIFRYSIQQFGVLQTEKYMANLSKVFTLLVEQPYIGMDSGDICPEIYRYTYQSHTIYYTPQKAQILIVRILHNKMDTRRNMQ